MAKAIHWPCFTQLAKASLLLLSKAKLAYAGPRAVGPKPAIKARPLAMAIALWPLAWPLLAKASFVGLRPLGPLHGPIGFNQLLALM